MQRRALTLPMSCVPPLLCPISNPPRQSPRVLSLLPIGKHPPSTNSAQKVSVLKKNRTPLIYLTSTEFASDQTIDSLSYLQQSRRTLSLPCYSHPSRRSNVGSVLVAGETSSSPPTYSPASSPRLSKSSRGASNSRHRSRAKPYDRELPSQLMRPQPRSTSTQNHQQSSPEPLDSPISSALPPYPCVESGTARVESKLEAIEKKLDSISQCVQHFPSTVSLPPSSTPPPAAQFKSCPPALNKPQNNIATSPRAIPSSFQASTPSTNASQRSENAEKPDLDIPDLLKCLTAFQTECIACWFQATGTSTTHTLFDCPNRKANGRDRDFFAWKNLVHFPRDDYCYACGLDRTVSIPTFLE